MDLTPPKRRRGAALESALLDAAWAELVELGYAGMTYEGVARRASTSRPVVYRRWPTKPELALAAVRHWYDEHPIALPDTGTLRGDVIALLEEFHAKRRDIMPLFLARLGAYFEETGTNVADLRDTLTLASRAKPLMDPILERAAARGEISLSTITPRLAAVPIDLFRNELLIGGAIGRATIESIVDEVFLPLVTLRPAPSRHSQ